MPYLAVQRRGLLSICLGNLVEFYDFAAFGGSAAVLALVLTRGEGELTAIFALLAAALVIRPIGAVLVGWFSDRQGRRTPFLVVTLLTCGATAAVGLLPGAARAGAGAAVGLLVLRSVQAFCTGGEISTSVPYLVEFAPPARRGLFGGFHLASAAAGMALGLAAVAVVQVALPTDALLAWGWRVPFLVAVPLALAVLGLRGRLQESAQFPARTSAGPPADPEPTLKGLPRSTVPGLIRQNPRTVVSGVLLAGAFSASLNLWFVYVPAHLLASHRSTPAAALGPAVAGLLTCAVLAPLAGALSDRIGRPIVLVVACAALCLLWPVAFPRVISGGGWWPFALASVAVGAALSGFVLGSHLPEAFAPTDRALGVGLTYGLGSAVLGGLGPLVGERLVTRGQVSAVVVYPLCWAVLAAASLAWAGRRPDTTVVGPGEREEAAVDRAASSR